MSATRPADRGRSPRLARAFVATLGVDAACAVALIVAPVVGSLPLEMAAASVLAASLLAGSELVRRSRSRPPPSRRSR